MKTLRKFFEESNTSGTFEDLKKMNRVYTIPECSQKQEMETTINQTVTKLTKTLNKNKMYFMLQITKELKKEENPLLLEYKHLIAMKLHQQGYNINNFQYYTTEKGETYYATF